MTKKKNGGVVKFAKVERKRFTAGELNAQCDLEAPVPADMAAWEQVERPGVGDDFGSNFTPLTPGTYSLHELTAEMPDGFPRVEGWDAMTPVGKELLGGLADQAKASAERASTAIDEALDFCEASNKRIEAMESPVKAKSSEPEEPFFKTLDEVIAEESPSIQSRIKAAGDKLAAKRDAAVKAAKGPPDQREDFELNAIADARQGRPEVRVTLDELIAEIPAGPKFEEWDVGPPVGKEILEVESILLSQRDAAAIAAAIENPPPPNKHLKAAVARARQIKKKSK
jgi:hypothetical protein